MWTTPHSPLSFLFSSSALSIPPTMDSCSCPISGRVHRLCSAAQVDPFSCAVPLSMPLMTRSLGPAFLSVSPLCTHTLSHVLFSWTTLPCCLVGTLPTLVSSLFSFFCIFSVGGHCSGLIWVWGCGKWAGGPGGPGPEGDMRASRVGAAATCT